MPNIKLLTFADLQERGVVSNRMQLKRLIDNHGFPEGFLLSANARRWREQDVAVWLEQREAVTAGEKVSTPDPVTMRRGQQVEASAQ